MGCYNSCGTYGNYIKNGMNRLIEVKTKLDVKLFELESKAKRIQKRKSNFDKYYK